MTSRYFHIIHVIRSIPVLHSSLWRVRSGLRRIERCILVRRPVVDAAPLLKDAVMHRRPYAAGKMGNVELSGLCTYLKRERARRGNYRLPPYPAYVAETLHVSAGVFPPNDDAYDRFGAIYLDAVKQCDALCAWDVAGEAQLFRGPCRGATLIRLRSLEPYFSGSPWSAALEGRRVLVISPFVATIRSQYARRSALWDDPRVLPAFELLTVRVPLSAAIRAPESPDWPAALEKLKAEMDALEFDVALIGAGAFSLPLAVHAKLRGKVGIHLGGALQILFGIIGRRWENRKDFKPFIRDSWTRPSRDETPEGVTKIENGCYW